MARSLIPDQSHLGLLIPGQSQADLLIFRPTLELHSRCGLTKEEQQTQFDNWNRILGTTAGSWPLRSLICTRLSASWELYCIQVIFSIVWLGKNKISIILVDLILFIQYQIDSGCHDSYLVFNAWSIRASGAHDVAAKHDSLNENKSFCHCSCPTWWLWLLSKADRNVRYSIMVGYCGRWHSGPCYDTNPELPKVLTVNSSGSRNTAFCLLCLLPGRPTI